MAPGIIEHAGGKLLQRIEGDATHTGALAGKRILITDNPHDKVGLYMFEGGGVEEGNRKRLLPGNTVVLDGGTCVIPE